MGGDSTFTDVPGQANSPVLGDAGPWLLWRVGCFLSSPVPWVRMQFIGAPPPLSGPGAPLCVPVLPQERPRSLGLLHGPQQSV